MDLQRFVKDRKTELTAWVSFGGFELELKYGDRAMMRKVMERSTERKFNRRTHQQEKQINDEKFLKNLATMIVDWRGLTLGKLAGLINISVETGEGLNHEIPCTDANKMTLLREVYDLDNFIVQTCTDLQAFRANELETEIKNSETSQGDASG